MRYIVVPVRPLPPDDAGPAVTAAAGPGAPAAAGVPAPGVASTYDGTPTGYAPGTAAREPDDTLARWVATARSSLDACLVVDAGGTVAAVSPTAAELLGASPGALVGRSLDEALHLVDFTDGAREAIGKDRRIPPLIAVRENALSRGMMRVRLPGGERRMLDAVAAPIHDTDARPVGAVSFLASV